MRLTDLIDVLPAIVIGVVVAAVIAGSAYNGWRIRKNRTEGTPDTTVAGKIVLIGVLALGFVMSVVGLVMQTIT